MKNEKNLVECLKQQMFADFLFDGINDTDVWLDNLCFAEFIEAVVI